MSFLVQELTGKRPLLPPDLPMTPEVRAPRWGSLNMRVCAALGGTGHAGVCGRAHAPIRALAHLLPSLALLLAAPVPHRWRT